MFLQRDLADLPALASMIPVLRRGDSLTSFQYDIIKEGRSHLVFDDTFATKVPDEAKPVSGIRSYDRHANVRAIMKNASGSLRVVVARKDSIKNPRFRAIEKTLARLVFGDGGLTVRNDPLGRSMHTLAGRTGKMQAFLSNQRLQAEAIPSPQAGEAEYVANEHTLYGAFGTGQVSAIPFDILDELKTAEQVRWAVAYKGKGNVAWMARPMPDTGAIMIGRWGESAMDAHNKAMYAQGFIPTRGSDGRPELEPMTDPIACGGKNAVAFDGLTCGGSARDLFAVLRPYAEAGPETALPIVKPLGELDEPLKKLIDTMLRSN